MLWRDVLHPYQIESGCCIIGVAFACWEVPRGGLQRGQRTDD